MSVEKRSKSVQCQVRPSEYQQLKELQEQKGFYTESDYIRFLILKDIKDNETSINNLPDSNNSNYISG